VRTLARFGSGCHRPNFWKEPPVMRACILAVAALLVAACTGCHGINLAKGHCDACGGCPGGHCAGGHCAGGHCGGGHFGHGHGGAHHGGYGQGGYGHGGYAHHGHGPHGTPGFPHHHGHHRDREYVGPQGPQTAQVAYPYYTIRGPRDFLLDNPPSIGR
jgi:hypothetical protein